ncbi:MAG: site-specific DNA-methyltransferase [Candidatus Promineofilum sp.]|nr:site-specific DNA-methyltransferase [Promineifilum sp.]
MNNLSLFDTPSTIAPVFQPDAQLVLYQGDTGDFIDSLPNEAVKLIVTSPPYNLGKEYEDRVSIERYLEEQAHIIQRLLRILHPQGSICWQVGNFVERGEVFPLDIYYYPIFKRLGLQLRNRIIWHFEHGLHTSKRFSGRYETILWFSKSADYTFNLDPVRVPSKYPGKRHYKGPNKGKPSGNPQGKNPSDVWDGLAQEWDDCFWEIPNVKSNHPEKTEHPCQFPIELVERCVLALTNEGDWVFDPYAGVGSALIAAVKRGRRGMGSERDASYVATARQRIEAFWRGELKIRPLGKPVHVPSGREKVSRVPPEWQDAPIGQGRLLEEQEKYE